MIKYSVVVPIYKVEKFLNKCVDSILSQSFEDFEVILVDDGSPDNCSIICDNYAKQDKRVRVIHKKNAGLVAARNTGIREARGEYICYVDGDDWIEKDLLDKVYRRGISTNKSDIIIYGAKKVFDDHEEKIAVGPTAGFYEKAKLASDVYPYMMYDNRKPFCTGLIFPVAWNKVFKRCLLLEHFCKDERVRMGEDNAFVYECLYAANSITFIDDVLYCYNQLNSGSMLHTYDENRFQNNQWLTEYISGRIGGINDVLDNQINAFKAYWLIMAIFHEVKCKRNIFVSALHIRKNIKQLNVLEGISNKGLPKSAKAFILLLRLHLYVPALLGARVINSIR